MMNQPRKYMAGSVPRFLRQTRLAHVPPSCVIGSKLQKGDGGANIVFDIIMLPMQEFTRMKSQVGLQHVIAPGPQMGPSFNPSFVMANAKEVTVPAEEPNPENYAKTFFLLHFGLLEPDPPAT